MMLAMGDRANGTSGSNQTDTKFSKWFGSGRAKLRFAEAGQPSFNPGAYWMVTNTFTSSSSDYTFFAFGGPVPSGTKLVKCVSFPHEDMSGKDTISKVGLELRLEPNCQGACGLISYSPIATRIDSSCDNRKMVSFRDSDCNVENMYAEVTVDKEWVSSAGSVTVNTFCMATSELDNAPN